MIWLLHWFYLVVSDHVGHWSQTLLFSTIIALGMLVTPLANDVPLVPMRGYQSVVFWDHETKTQIIHWSRQTGKSYTLAAWAVKRLIDNPGRLVTVLSNSKDNGAEFALKCTDVARKFGIATDAEDLSEDLKFENMRFEVRIAIGDAIGRIKVLAANPRTARGFSGDLILDEFAFHEDSRAIWEAAEPIISSNPDYLCRIASTGNGRLNMFYQLISEGRMPYYRVRRSDAWASGELKIYSAVDGKEITPEQAREEASDKRAYDQNYECTFEDENMPLLTHELISAAQRVTGIVVDKQVWSPATLQRLWRAQGPLEAGMDVARSRDLSAVPVFERIGARRVQIAELIMENMRLPEQIAQVRLLLNMPRMRRIEIDMTGIGLGVFEILEDEFPNLVGGVNFGTTEAVTDRIRADGRKAPTARVTEIMATDLLGVFEDKTIEIINDPDLRDDLRKPEKVVSPGGRVSIAASRDGKGHADRFWGMALAVRAGYSLSEVGAFHRFNSMMQRLTRQAVECIRNNNGRSRRRRQCIG
ncbi:terminase family protein [soil metagenome]